MWSGRKLLFRGSSHRVLRDFHSAKRALVRHVNWQQQRPAVSASWMILSVGLVATATSVHWEEDESELFVSRSNTRLDAAVTAEELPTTTLLNWSGTHAVHVRNDRLWEPETVQEVEAIVKACHEAGQAVRPLGSALSPNGIAFQPDGMLSLANLDKVIQVTTTTTSSNTNDIPTVTVQAGARVSQVIEALRPYHLTLPNLASIAEQQMGGFVQVGAHGTGRCIGPVDHYVTKLKLVTPGQGTIELSRDDQDERKQLLFQLAKVGLGCLGVVVEVTMECIPAHNLVEHTFVITRQQAKERLDTLLKEHKHMRYMWIPYADAVVVVTNDPVRAEGKQFQTTIHAMTPEERLEPMTSLLLEVTKDHHEPITKESLKGMGFGEIRDALLAVAPLDIDHVKRCNEAEAEFWRRSEGYQVKPSDQLLQFDCGGQQWVWEVCFPTGTQEQNNGNDMLFMEQLLAGIERESIPAHSPIEQRWTASSSSLMSPAHGPADGLHSWVGIINYLPSDHELQRRQITDLFRGPYCDLMRTVGKKVRAASHWAKLERPASLWGLIDLQLSLQERFPVALFNKMRSIYDPKNILANPLLNLLLGDHRNEK